MYFVRYVWICRLLCTHTPLPRHHVLLSFNAIVLWDNVIWESQHGANEFGKEQVLKKWSPKLYAEIGEYISYNHWHLIYIHTMYVWNTTKSNIHKLCIVANQQLVYFVTASRANWNGISGHWAWSIKWRLGFVAETSGIFRSCISGYELDCFSGYAIRSSNWCACFYIKRIKTSPYHQIIGLLDVFRDDFGS